MALGNDGHAIHGSTRTAVVTVDIDPRLLDELEALPDAAGGALRHEWTAEEDAVLLKYWKSKRQVDVARILGLAANTCRERWRQLTGAA